MSTPEIMTTDLAPNTSRGALVKSPNVRGFEMDAADKAAAAEIGVVLSGDVEDRLTRAAAAYNTATRLAVEAGYLLMSVKSELQHGQFEERIAVMRLSSQRASELMRTAKFASALSPEQRTELLRLPKTKLTLLAGADPEVIDDVLENADIDLNAMSVRELRQRLKDLEAEKTDSAVKLEKAEAELDAIKQKANKISRADNVPVVVADLREDLTAEIKKADLAGDAIQVCLQELNGLELGAVAPWVKPTAQMALAGMAGVVMRLQGLMKGLVELVGDEALTAEIPPAAYLSPDEVGALALRYSELTRQANHEKELRDWNRKQARPARGRPTAKPTL